MKETKTSAQIENQAPVEEPLDFAKILGDKRVLFFGDNHKSHSDKEAFKVVVLPELVKLGFTDLALEMLPVGFNTDDAEAVKDYLIRNWSKGSSMSEEYYAIYARARELGMRVWGIDISMDEYDAQSPSVTFDRRNGKFADETATHLRADPDSKVVVLNGSAHAGYYPGSRRANRFLRDKGFDSVVVRHRDRNQYTSLFIPEEQMMQKLLQDKTRQDKTRQDPFMVKITTPSRSADYMIHIPTAI